MKVIIGVESEPRMQFTIDVNDTDNMPDLIRLKDNQLLKLVGCYASPGIPRFCYRHVNGTLNFDGQINDWIRYQPLIG